MADESGAERGDPQGRADRIRAFEAELAELEGAGILRLDAEQRAAVAAHHEAALLQLARDFDADTSESMRQLSLGLRLTTLLGMAALSAAVVLFVQQFWGHLPTAAQLGLAVAAPLVPLAIAELAARRERTLYIASLFATVSLAGLAINLVVVKEVLNYPDGPHPVLAWGGYALLMAYRFRARLHLAAGLITVGWWVAASLYSTTGGWFEDILVLPETIVVPGLIVVLIPAVVRHTTYPAFGEIYRVLGIVTLGALAALLSLNGHFSVLPFGRRGVEMAYTLGGLTLGIGAIVTGVRRGWTGTTRAGTAVALLLMLAKAVDWWWRLVPAWVFFLLLGALALLAIAGLKRLRGLAVATS